MADKRKTGGTLETKWSVRDIQRAIVSYTHNDNAIPNVSWGFFGSMECDLVQLTDSDRIHEFEIKRSWSDFLADFKKARFHDDICICRLTFVLPESFAGDRLKKFCADHYAEFKREFDFLFYTEGDRCEIVQGQWVMDGWKSQCVLAEPFRTDTYITEEMLQVIRRNDVAAPYRRRLFTEELARLYRLGVIRLWHNKDLDDATEKHTGGPIMADTNETTNDIIAAGNSAKLREALTQIHAIATSRGAWDVATLADTALKSPPRNCDVGTAEEQAERYGRYCEKIASDGKHCETCPCCGKIPFGKCEFAWAQMPYEEQEGGAS